VDGMSTVLIRYAGTDKHGTARGGCSDEPLALLVERFWRAGWKAATFRRGDEVELVGRIDRSDRNSPIWWCER
jgi:hypothetical protein